MLTETDARGKTITHQYDALNRLTQTTFKDDSQISYIYDTGTENRGRLMQLIDPNGSTSWSYDGQGRITQRRQHLDGVQLTVRYGLTPRAASSSSPTPRGRP